MKKEDLKSGLFGYKKASVFRYIAEIEQEYSEKINEKEILAKKAEEQYLMHYAALEKELQEAQNQIENMKQMLEMKEKEAEQEKRNADIIRKKYDEKAKEAEQKQAKIEHIVSSMQDLLNEITDRSAQIDLQPVKTGSEENRDSKEENNRNMSMFQRRANQA